jgi:alpha/beta superfamily hydrolase
MKKILPILSTILMILILASCATAEDVELNGPIDQEVEIQGPAGILAGTLSVPANPRAVAVLISGSGAQDRDETIMSHKPFLELTGFFLSMDIAVLRYDDRGTAQSEGDFASATTFDFKEDAKAAIQFAQSAYPDLDTIAVGHSEGGMIAVLLRAENIPDAVISLAGPFVSGRDLLLMQTRRILETSGANEAVIQNALGINQPIYDLLLEYPTTGLGETELEQLSAEISQKLQEAGLPEAQVNANLQVLLSEWYRTFLSINPADYLGASDRPLFAVFAELDVQVPAELNIEALQAVGTEGDFEIATVAGVNHLFQEAETGALNEYARSMPTMNQALQETLSIWLEKRYQ